MPMTKIMSKYWYRIVTHECPLCGRSVVYRERVYGDKPKDPALVYDFKQIYDWCEG